MKIGIISDSHDHFENIKKSIIIFKDKKVDYVIHLGDFVNLGSIKLFQGIKLVGIFGNNDGDKFMHNPTASDREIPSNVTDESHFD